MSALPVKNPPIAEAIFEMQVELPGTLDLQSLEKPLRGAFGLEYPEVRKQYTQEHKITVSAKQPTEAAAVMKSRFHGYQFCASNQKSIHQVKDKAYSFNKLPPYSSFDDHIAEVKRGWQIYCEHCRPVVVRRVGLRYINKIPIPVSDPAIRLEDYFLYGPHFPDESTVFIAQFTHKQTVIERESGLWANTTLSLNHPGLKKATLGPDDFKAIFDIDTYWPKDSISPSDPKIWELFDLLRDFKNRIFERSLTPRCLSLFQ